MTETAFPFGGADAGAPGPVGDEESTNRRPVMFVAAGAGVLLLLVAAWFLFLRGGNSAGTDTGLVPSAHHPVAAAAAKHPAAKAATKAHTAVKRMPKSFQDVVGRDPFVALYTPPVAKAPTTAGAGTGTTTGTTESGAPSTDNSGSTGTTTAVGQRVSLIRIYSKGGKIYATTKVDSTVYNPRVGSAFATSFQLLSAKGKTATYLDGDVQFTLTVGQEVLK